MGGRRRRRWRRRSRTRRGAGSRACGGRAGSAPRATARRAGVRRSSIRTRRRGGGRAACRGGSSQSAPGPRGTPAGQQPCARSSVPRGCAPARSSHSHPVAKGRPPRRRAAGISRGHHATTREGTSPSVCSYLARSLYLVRHRVAARAGPVAGHRLARRRPGGPAAVAGARGARPRARARRGRPARPAGPRAASC